MSVTNIIKLSELERDRRIDAEYYQKEFLDKMNIIMSLNSKTIRQISKSVLSFGAYSLCNYIVWRESGIPYLKAENILEGYIDFSEIMFIDDNVHSILHKSQVMEEQILFSMSGTTGNAAVAYNIPLKLNSNQDIAKITLKGEYSPFYVASFLNSRFGRFQTEREIVGSVQQHIFLGQIKQLRVPLLGKEIEKKIEKTCKEGITYLSLSEKLYSQAENLLLKELGLKDFKPKYELSYIANLSNVFKVHRVDAEYFQPAYDAVFEKISDYSGGCDQLLNYVENVKADFDPRKHADENFQYIELADIDASIGVISSSSKISGQEGPSRARRILRKDDVIVSSVEGSLEKVALIDELYEGSLASTGFFQFRPIGILPEVLLVLSKTIALQIQFKKECSGTILTAVPSDSLNRILIPILPDNVQKGIASLVQQSHEAKRKAKELLKEAKRKVEDGIENLIMEAKNESLVS